MEEKKKILIIEDEADMREALQTALIDAGFIALTSENTDEGLKLIMEKSPDLILLDVFTGTMHANVFLQRLRDLAGPQKDTKVIILSNIDHEPTIEKANALGVEKYLIKSDNSLEEIVTQVKNSVQ